MTTEYKTNNNTKNNGKHPYSFNIKHTDFPNPCDEFELLINKMNQVATDTNKSNANNIDMLMFSYVFQVNTLLCALRSFIVDNNEDQKKFLLSQLPSNINNDDWYDNDSAICKLRIDMIMKVHVNVIPTFMNQMSSDKIVEKQEELLDMICNIFDIFKSIVCHYIK